MTDSWFTRMATSAAIESLAALVQSGGRSSATGSVGSSTTVVVAALVRRTGRRALVVCPHLDEVDQVMTELGGAGGVGGLGLRAIGLPAIEGTGPTGSGSEEVSAERLQAVDLIVRQPPEVVVASMAALMQPIATPEAIAHVLRVVRRGTRLSLSEFLGWMQRGGYARVSAVETPGEFAVRGGIVDIFPSGAIVAVRLDLFGDEVESLHEIDAASQANDRSIEEVAIVSLQQPPPEGSGSIDPGDLLGSDAFAVIAELSEVDEQARAYWERVEHGSGIRSGKEVLASLVRRLHAVVDIGAYSPAAQGDRCVSLPVQTVPILAHAPDEAIRQLIDASARCDCFVWADSGGEADRLNDLLGGSCAATATPGASPAPRAIHVETRLMRGGFVWAAGDEPFLGVTGHELLNRFGRIERRRAAMPGAGESRSAREAFLHFETGDYVVHRDRGIGRFLGLRELGVREAGVAGGFTDEREFMEVEYAKGEKLFVPLSKAVLVQRYIGAGAGRPRLSEMGGKRWEGQKGQVAEAVKDLAAALLRVQAVRESTAGVAFPADTQWQARFEAEFPFEETPDQVQTIRATKQDMERARPMDRLVCGDVGFGKTEVAIRAAFKCCQSGRQVALLVPTTVLAEQHTRTFTARFGAYPFRVECISRFRSDPEIRNILDDVAQGRVDVLVGTHRLLSKDVRFQDLSLVVVDEEQRFGVEHKQRLLELRLTADVLTLSATPIPRTLHMAMLGLRDISSLTTPPLDRRPIATEVLPWQRERLQQAIARELAREGQVYFVHNRIHDIEEVAAEVQAMAPDARVVVGHGQMGDGELERVMVEFLARRADILVSTTIIENGLDIPTANTIIIDQAHLFGLSELHQLRGRVGRSRHRAYCLLLFDPTKPVTADALRRLRAIEEFSMLGAGFRISVRDLEIRGAGNILGAEQSGHIGAVGYEMYCQLLGEAVRRLRHEPTFSAVDTHVELGASGGIPASSIPSERRRIEAWRRIGSAQTMEALDQVFKDLEGAYGQPAAAVRVLHQFAAIRLQATLTGTRMLVRREGDLVFRTQRPDLVEKMLKREKGTRRRVEVTNDAGLTDLYWRPPEGSLSQDSLVETLDRLYRSVQCHSR